MTTRETSSQIGTPDPCSSVEPTARSVAHSAGAGASEPCPRADCLRRLIPAVAAPAAAAVSAITATRARADDVPADVDPGAVIVKLLRRTSYGVTPELLEHASAMGFDAYLDEQLNPDSLDDTAFAQQF